MPDAEIPTSELLADLVATSAPPGALVLEVGFGGGDAGAAFARRGLSYAACDADPVIVAALWERGVEARVVDPTAAARLAGQLVGMAAGRRMAAVVVQDVLGTVPDLNGFLEALTTASRALDNPTLAVAISNVGHFDVAAKLVTGRWDVTPSGLLASDRLHHFTGSRLDAELHQRGWVPVARADVDVVWSDQHFPAAHPALVTGAPLRDLLHDVRARSGDGAETVRLVRSYSLARSEAEGDDQTTAAPFLTVIVRTQGQRLRNLTEALTCLAAQTDPDFDVNLLVHSDEEEHVAPFDAVRELVDQFAPTFARRVVVRRVHGGGRACPLNAGLHAARSRYVAFLDDDDLVTADWVERFRAGADEAPGRVVRSITVDRRVRRTRNEGPGAPYEAVGGLQPTHAARFDVLEHFSRNRTPICSFAVPVDAVRATRLQFDEDLVVLEDWKFLLESALLSGVHDTGSVTSVYHRWEDGGSTAAEVEKLTWEDTHRAVVASFDVGPLLLPPGSAGRIALMYQKAAILDHEMPLHNAERASLATRLEAADAALIDRDRRLETSGAAIAERDRQLEDLHRELEERGRELAQMQASRAWRLTAPIRRAAAVARAIVRAVSRRGRR